MHPIGGDVSCYLNLTRHFEKDQPFYAVKSPGLIGETKPFTRIEDMANQYISAIRSVQKKGPYLLGGWSMGGMVAFEMAQKLLEQGESMSLLALLDIPQELVNKKAERESVGHFFNRLIRDLGLPLNSNDSETLNKLLLVESKGKLNNFSELVDDKNGNEGLNGLFKKLAEHFGLKTDQVIFLLNRYYELGQDKLLDHVGEYVDFVNKESHKTNSSETLRRLQVYFNNYLATRTYKPRVYKNTVHLFISSETIGTSHRDPTSGWKNFFAGGLEIHKIPGNHYTMMDEPNVRILAEKLRDCL